MTRHRRRAYLPLGGTTVACALLLGSPCGPTATTGPSAVRFRLTLGADVEPPVYVQVVGQDAQPGWVRVARSGERIYLRERCEVPDCGASPAVCGASVPVVRDVVARGATRTIDVEWDGAMSFVDPASRCERRTPVPAGDYVATFCYSRQVELAGGSDGADLQGVLRQPTCRDVPFSLPGSSDVQLSLTSATF